MSFYRYKAENMATKRKESRSVPKKPTVRGTDWEHPTGKLPKKVILLALGPSRNHYFDWLVKHDNSWDEYDEIWGINTCIKFKPDLDLLWVMDDMDLYTRHFPAYYKALSETKVPIMTNNVVYKEFPTAVSYPDHHILRHLNGGYAYFNDSSLPWVFAYCVWLGIEQIALFGIDYSNPLRPDRELEKGRICAEWWAGYMAGSGITLVLPQDTTFMDRILMPQKRPYGYLKPPSLTFNGHPQWL